MIIDESVLVSSGVYCLTYYKTSK